MKHTTQKEEKFWICFFYFYFIYIYVFNEIALPQYWTKMKEIESILLKIYKAGWWEFKCLLNRATKHKSLFNYHTIDIAQASNYFTLAILRHYKRCYLSFNIKLKQSFSPARVKATAKARGWNTKSQSLIEPALRDKLMTSIFL